METSRVLHVQVLNNDLFQGLELIAHRKLSLRKIDLHSHQPDEERQLDPKELPILQSWLAARYRRQALPDALQDRMRPFFKKMERLGSQNVEGIIGYWFDYEPRQELSPGEPYEVKASVVYSEMVPVLQTFQLT